MQDHFITPKQAAAYGVPLSTVYRWCKEGRVSLLKDIPDDWVGKYYIEKASFLKRAAEWAGLHE